MNPERTNRTISITVLPQANGQYLCQMSTDLSDCPTNDTLCYGQTKEHVIAIALEQLANHYRQIAEQQQNRDWDAVEQTEAGELIAKHYHVILHCERIAGIEPRYDTVGELTRIVWNPRSKVTYLHIGMRFS